VLYAFFAVNRVFDSRMALRLSGLRLLIPDTPIPTFPRKQRKKQTPARLRRAPPLERGPFPPSTPRLRVMLCFS